MGEGGRGARTTVVAAAALLALLAAAGPAAARDAASAANIRITGAQARDLAGSSVAGVGDVNGDGRPDLAISAPRFDPPGRTDAGAVFVVFGRAAPATVNLRNLGADGFRIDGPAAHRCSPAGAQAGTSVDGVGDMNGDGFGDLVLSAPADCNAYVVFGAPAPATVDTSALGARGFAITTANPDSEVIGNEVAGGGDVNGDGRPDVVVEVGLDGDAFAGDARVVYGKATPGDVLLDTPSSQRGFSIHGAADDANLGASLDIVPDMNGDGKAEVLAGAPGASFFKNDPVDRGNAYVVFGRADAAALEARTIGNAGFRIAGARVGDHAGTGVSAAGDVTGDGKGDLVVGAPGADFGGRDAGAAYLVSGKASAGTVSLSRMKPGVRRIDGARAGHALGSAVAGVGDANGDGRPDVAAGAPGARPHGVGSGAIFVVFTPQHLASVRSLRRLGAGGLRVDGPNPGGEKLPRFGPRLDVAGAGDLNGDGRTDLLTGFPQVNTPNGVDSGAAFGVFAPGAGG